MEEQLVSFETAKLAKEGRYNELCTRWYYIEDLYDGEKVGELYETDEVYFNDQFDGSASAPTQSLLQKWLREKYAIIVSVFIQFEPKNDEEETDEFFEFIYYIHELEKMRENEDEVLPYISVGTDKYMNNNYKTYEEALEEGLQEALKLITL